MSVTVKYSTRSATIPEPPTHPMSNREAYLAGARAVLKAQAGSHGQMLEETYMGDGLNDLRRRGTVEEQASYTDSRLAAEAEWSGVAY